MSEPTHGALALRALPTHKSTTMRSTETVPVSKAPAPQTREEQDMEILKAVVKRQREALETKNGEIRELKTTIKDLVESAAKNAELVQKADDKKEEWEEMAQYTDELEQENLALKAKVDELLATKMDWNDKNIENINLKAELSATELKLKAKHKECERKDRELKRNQEIISSFTAREKGKNSEISSLKHKLKSEPLIQKLDQAKHEATVAETKVVEAQERCAKELKVAQIAQENEEKEHHATRTEFKRNSVGFAKIEKNSLVTMRELSETKTQLEILGKNAKLMRVIVEDAALVRSRFLAADKGYPNSHEVRQAGNESVHGGNFLVDHSLYALGYIDKDHDFWFHNAYRTHVERSSKITDADSLRARPRFLKMMNMHASIHVEIVQAADISQTPGLIQRFLSLLEQCEERKDGFSGSEVERNISFERDEEIGAKIDEMASLVYYIRRERRTASR